MDYEELQRRFTAAEVDENRAAQIGELRGLFLSIADRINDSGANPRDLGVALTQLEIACWAAVSAVAKAGR